MNQQTFINEDIIQKTLTRTSNPSRERVNRILQKALLLKGLKDEEIAALINIEDQESRASLFKTALTIKEIIYGKRLVLFAPLYVSNYCSNNCLYCGFRQDNHEMKRLCLSPDEIKQEVQAILGQGHKRILMLMGEHPSKCSFEYFLESINTAYTVVDSKGSSLRRINIEIAPLSDEECGKLSTVRIGTYTVFQETYHQETYRNMHPAGKKADYAWRLYCMDRALKNGLHDVGIGALFGLYDYRFEVLALIQHAKHLERECGVGPHTISVPRIKPAPHAPASHHVPNPVSDDDFKKLVAVLRCAVPYTGMILSTRESPGLRQEIFNLGISQISAGSRTTPGGYTESSYHPHSPPHSKAEEGQFSLEDHRSSEEVIKAVIKQGFIPSFCTACYRLGRVGADFMDIAKPGDIKLYCLPNALSTLQEYLEDYADDETKSTGETIIQENIKHIPSDERRNKTREYIERIKKGERDLYF